jgi:Tfp pilus assembly protein PilF
MIRHLSARPIMKETTGVKAETGDPRLAAALRLAGADMSPENRLRVAEQYLRLGITDTAYIWANGALLQTPRFARAHEMVARIWRDWGFPDLGLASASRAAYFDPASASAANTLGTIFDALGQPVEAERAFKRAAALDSTVPWALNNLCFVELRMGRLAEARSHCQAALTLDPRMAAAGNNLALTYVASGDAAAAGRAFLTTGNAADAAYNRGIVHMAGREYQRAAEAFEQAIAERPSFTAAKARAHEARVLAITSAHD